jgi:outer membrane protein OmpA-like peptidoglycan-associated protein
VKFFLLLILAASFLPGAAIAQVSVNSDALAQLDGVSAARPTAPEAAPSVRHTPEVRHRRHVVTEAKKPPVVIVPVVARAAPAAPKPPVPPVPPVPRIVPPPVPVNIAFAADSATLPAGAQPRLAPFCKVSGPIVINARAPADPEDNSHSMRLSLARALAVRAVLSACGVASQNIFPRALGAAPRGATDNTQIQAGLNP